MSALEGVDSQGTGSALGDGQPADLEAPVQADRQITSLQWAIGIFCAVLGALMLVLPHQFAGPIWVALAEYLPWAGAGYLMAGVALVGCSIPGARRSWLVLAHILVAAALLLLLYNNVMLGTWGGVVIYASLTAGTLLAPFVNDFGRPGRRISGDYLALVFGAVCGSYGATMLLLPGLFDSPAYSPMWPYLSSYGAAFLLAGAAMMVAQVIPALPAALYRAVHLAVLVPSVAYAIAIPIPLLSFPGIFLFVGFALFVASLPWTGPRLRRVDPRSFVVRLAFVLAIATTLPLTVITGIVTDREERLTRAEAEAGMEASAASLASAVSQYVGLHQAALDALATYPGLLALTSADQRVVLRGVNASFPDGLAFSIIDAAGQEIARSDDRPLVAGAGSQTFEQARRSNARSLATMVSQNYQVPIFAMISPIRGVGGHFAGGVATGISSGRVAAILRQIRLPSGSRVYLVDAAGRAIAHPDQSLVASFADLSSTSQVAALLASPGEQGIVSDGNSSRGVLAAYSRVPDLGWSVVVDRPAGAALAPVRRGREEAFGLLLVFVVLAVVAGSMTARQLSRPLAALSRAAGRLAGGDSTASLPRGGAGEIVALVTAFGDMRDKLAARTAQREGLLKDNRRQRELLERLIASASMGIALISCPDFRYEMANSRYRQASRTADRPVLGRTLQEVFPPAAAERAVATMREVCETGRVVNLRATRSANLDIVGHWDADHVPILGPDGAVEMILLLNWDVTDLMEARRQAEAAAQSRDEFLSVAAHELKTPVTGMLGYAQMLLRQHEQTRDGRAGTSQPGTPGHQSAGAQAI